MTFNDLLALHKERFEAWRAVVVLDDKPLRRHVLSWGPQMVRQVSDWPLGNGLADLWECVHVDFEALAELTGEPQVEVRMRFRQARGLGLLYPDGTVAKPVRDLLHAKVKEIRGKA
jgi:hypothetical protein